MEIEIFIFIVMLIIIEENSVNLIKLQNATKLKFLEAKFH